MHLNRKECSCNSRLASSTQTANCLLIDMSTHRHTWMLNVDEKVNERVTRSELSSRAISVITHCPCHCHTVGFSFFCWPDWLRNATHYQKTKPCVCVCITIIFSYDAVSVYVRLAAALSIEKIQIEKKVGQMSGFMRFNKMRKKR